MAFKTSIMPHCLHASLRAKILVLLWVCLVLAASASAETPAPGNLNPDTPGLSAAERLDVLLQRIEAQRGALTTLRATVQERKTSPLLLQPEDVEGTFLFASPDRARWELRPTGVPVAGDGAGEVKPESTVIVLDGDEMLTWYRHLKRAERLRLEGRGRRMMQFFGPGSSLEDLRRYFDFRFTRSAQAEVPYRLELLPRNRRVARRVRHVTLDIDRRLFVPVYVHFEEAQGASTEYWFRDVEPDVDIEENAFDLDLPDDVEVREMALGDATP